MTNWQAAKTWSDRFTSRQRRHVIGLRPSVRPCVDQYLWSVPTTSSRSQLHVVKDEDLPAGGRRTVGFPSLHLCAAISQRHPRIYGRCCCCCCCHFYADDLCPRPRRCICTRAKHLARWTPRFASKLYDVLNKNVGPNEGTTARDDMPPPAMVQSTESLFATHTVAKRIDLDN